MFLAHGAHGTQAEGENKKHKKCKMQNASLERATVVLKGHVDNLPHKVCIWQISYTLHSSKLYQVINSARAAFGV